jgi:hypothetical protein
VTRFLHFLEKLTDAGILAVLVFTPLAFGAVEVWSRSATQVLIVIVVAAWTVKTIWAPPRMGIRSRPGMILNGRMRLSGLEWPGLAFALLVTMQLVPLPPGMIRAVSPHTAAVYAASLPGYGQPGEHSFSDLPSWLESHAQPDAGGVPVLEPAPGAVSAAMPAAWFDVGYSKWRPLSLTPAQTRRALGIFLAHLAFFVVVFNRLEHKPGLQRMLVVIAGLVGVLSTIGIFQSLTSDNKIYWWRDGGQTHSFGPFVNANNFANWMAMGLPIAAGLTFLFWRSRRSRAPASVLLFGFFTILGFVALVLAESRGGFVSLLGALVLVVAVYGWKRRVRPAAVVLSLAALILAIGMAVWIDWPSLRERYGTLADVSQEHSFQSRVRFTRATLDIAVDFPVLGTGLGTFREAYYLYTPGTSSKELTRAHNDYAQVAAECGFAGALVMLWGLIVLLLRGVVHGLRRRSDGSTWFVVPASVGVLAMALHSFVDFNLQIYSNSLLFVCLAAVLMRSRANADAAKP